MPRFFFHYRDGAQWRADPEGSVLPDAEAAWYQAVRNAREIFNQNMRSGFLRPGQCVAVADDKGQPISAISLEDVAGLAG